MMKSIVDSFTNASKAISDAILNSPIGEFLHGKKGADVENPEGPEGP